MLFLGSSEQSVGPSDEGWGGGKWQKDVCFHSTGSKTGPQHHRDIPQQRHHLDGHLMLLTRDFVATMGMNGGGDAHNFPKTNARTQKMTQSPPS